MGATASRVRRWLLVEQPGPWGREALTDSRLDHQIARTLARRARRHGVRVVLLRRAGAPPDGPEAAPGPRAVFMAHTGPRSSWIERLELDAPESLLTLDLSAVAGDEAPGVGAESAGIHLVCTNGRHDRCCAELGRPVVRALRSSGRTGVWECSHIGGDRFAANLVCLPTGVYFGRVPPERAPLMVDDLARGLLDLDHYRGRSCFPPLVQAAEIFARRHLSERRLAALTVVAVTPLGEHGASVVLSGDGPVMVEATVGRSRAARQHLTCGGEAEAEPWRYHLEAIEARPG